jgi:tRNA1Val (adenine37-N6)-methyltransferase
VKPSNLKSSPVGATTFDRLLDGRLSLWQPERGYRVTVDTLMLARFAASTGRPVVADLGCGAGAATVLLDAFAPIERVTLIDKDPTLTRLAELNARAAGIEASVHTLELGRDVLPRELDGSADMVICNPPFFDRDSGRPPRDIERLSARFGKIEPFIAAAARLLRGARARAQFAFPARSLSELVQTAARCRLVPKRIRFVHGSPRRPARLALVELRRGRAGGLVVEAPLFEWTESGSRSQELTALVLGSTVDRTELLRLPAR